MTNPRKPVTGQDITEALRGIEPGWYKTSELLPRFNAWAEAQGRAPVTPDALGAAIGREFETQRARYQSSALWLLNEDVLTHRDWFKS